MIRIGRKKRRILTYGLGAGLVGAGLFAIRRALHPQISQPLPDAISPAIFATRVFRSSQGQIVYHVSGSGEPVVFVHGLFPGASSYVWSKVYPRFALTHRVVAPDLIGFGESERPERILTAADHARSLAEFLAGTCDDHPVTLVGSDLGAGFCVLLATQHPERVARLVLLNPTGSCDPGRVPATLAPALRTPFLRGFLCRNYYARETVIRMWLAASGFADPTRVTEEMSSVFTVCAGQSGADRAILGCLTGRFDFDLLSRLRQVAQPVTVIRADRTSFPSADEADRIHAAIPRCTARVLEGAGFLAPLEAPDAMADLLAEELDPGLRVLPGK